MVKEIEKQIRVPDAERCDPDWCRVEALLDALKWDHYATNVDGEQIDSGDCGDDALDETIIVPYHQIDVFDLLDEAGIFDF